MDPGEPWDYTIYFCEDFTSHKWRVYLQQLVASHPSATRNGMPDAHGPAFPFSKSEQAGDFRHRPAAIGNDG